MRRVQWLKKQAYALIYLRLTEALDNGRIANDCLDDGLSEEETCYVCEIIHQAIDRYVDRSADTARRRSQGAKDGWDIRRAKQAKKEQS